MAAVRRIVRWGRHLALSSVSLFGIGCSVDLHEVTGPLVPVPNVQGQVLRDSIPAPGLRVRLQDGAGNTLSSERTNESGLFGFAEVGEGNWSVRVESGLPTDFARVTYEFSFLSADTSLTVPSLEIDLREMRTLAPEDSSVASVPGFFSPLTFTWEGRPGPKQVRFFETSAAGGEAIWYSVSDDVSSMRWNGLGTENSYVAVPISGGEYRWRLRWIEPGGPEYLTHYRHITLVP